MIPEGHSDMDRRNDLLLGEINGKLESLIREFTDHRNQTREALEDLSSKLEHLEVDVGFQKSTMPGLQSQIYSNKTEVDKLKITLELFKTIYTKITGIFTVLWIVGTAIFVGLGWVLSHWSEAFALAKSLMGYK